MSGVVERYLRHLDMQDWEALGTTLSDGPFERVGPFSDVIDDKARYLRFLQDVVPTLPRYRVRTRRVSTSGRIACAEINESFVLDGAEVDFPEVLVLDLDDQGLVARVQVYMMRPGAEAVAPGGRAAGPGGTGG